MRLDKSTIHNNKIRAIIDIVIDIKREIRTFENYNKDTSEEYYLLCKQRDVMEKTLYKMIKLQNKIDDEIGGLPMYKLTGGDY